MKLDKIVAIVEQAIVHIAKKKKTTSAETYALNALRMAQNALSDIAKERALVNAHKPITEHSDIKYKHTGVDCLDVIRQSIGDESTYIYCMAQVIKHMYLHEYDPNETTEYNKAEWYRQKATEIQNLHKEEW